MAKTVKKPRKIAIRAGKKKPNALVYASIVMAFLFFIAGSLSDYASEQRLFFGVLGIILLGLAFAEYYEIPKKKGR